jgi:hypothetical protein
MGIEIEKPAEDEGFILSILGSPRFSVNGPQSDRVVRKLEPVNSQFTRGKVKLRCDRWLCRMQSAQQLER